MRRIHVFPLIITDCTLLSLLQLITRTKQQVVQNGKQALFLWGTID